MNYPVIIIGIPSDPALRAVRQSLDRLGTEVIVLNQRESFSWDLRLGSRGDTGVLKRQHGPSIFLSRVSAVYSRMMDPRVLAAAEGHEEWVDHMTTLHRTLGIWLEQTAVNVLNRPSAMMTNSSKPYQSQLIRTAGFRVPRTIITNDPDAVRRFASDVGRVVYKSISGQRSVVRLLEPADDRRLNRISWCPTQFQEFLPGQNIRVHVIGDEVIATEIASEAVDYRYAEREGASVTMHATQVSSAVAESCVLLTRALRLGFSGVDLRLDGHGDPYCLEVNPMPAFTYFEDRTGQPIADAVARYLASPRLLNVGLAASRRRDADRDLRN